MKFKHLLWLGWLTFMAALVSALVGLAALFNWLLAVE